ncbi:uncharacterized protein LOC133783269 isoform X2 [Humulus lupulus]|uniref:uncharacterized protein LOC133783269 isoform X2 n=1 Tax=Humulus lupulus TaxID=3486 RepID=UPI002B4142E5|nr:uncharacterized protein LOC133783269 isoform X2 [Humulus lupulus]
MIELDRAMNVGDLHKVWEIKALKKPGEEEARKILENVAKQVQPIMRNHKWRVKLLTEFCPKNPSLLGLNVGGGIQVKLRLRRPNKDWEFFPFYQILDTMLHELCHNAHGPHNANFYNLWDELRKECEDLMSKGISGTGQGFDLPGRRLGGFTRQPSLSSLRSTALSAAEKRSRMNSLLPSGPKRLGGDSTIMVALSPVQAAAMAAERRLQDDIWCGSVSCDASECGESSSDKPEDLSHVKQTAGISKVHSTSSAYASDSISRKRSRESSNFSPAHPPNGHSQSNFIDLSPSGFNSDRDSEHNTQETTMWGCETCTLLNPPLAPICEVCGTPKPRDMSNKYKVWSCNLCTLENSVKLDKCCACSQWRYSHGPPVASQPPNLGT